VILFDRQSEAGWLNIFAKSDFTDLSGSGFLMQADESKI
jgi:hypothetical protein